jgi:hypothetical protein
MPASQTASRSADRCAGPVRPLRHRRVVRTASVRRDDQPDGREHTMSPESRRVPARRSRHAGCCRASATGRQSRTTAIRGGERSRHSGWTPSKTIPGGPETLSLTTLLDSDRSNGANPYLAERKSHNFRDWRSLCRRTAGRSPPGMGVVGLRSDARGACVRVCRGRARGLRALCGAALLDTIPRFLGNTMPVLLAISAPFLRLRGPDHTQEK